MKILLTLIIGFAALSAANATEQARDRLVINGRTYGIEQQPMLGLWRSDDWDSDGKDPLPSFDATSSANWRGYIATFSISGGKLHLLEIDARVAGKPTTGRELLGKRLPLVAHWFDGSVFVAVGDFDRDANASKYVIEFVIVNGTVTESRYHASLALPHTWNGLPRVIPKPQ